MIKYSPSVSCDMNNVTGINAIVKIYAVKITTIASNYKDIYKNKPPLPTDVFEDVNTSILCFNTTDIDDIEGSNSYSLKDIARCFTLHYVNRTLLNSCEMKIWIIYMCKEALRHLAIWRHLLFWRNKSTPFEWVIQNIIVIRILWSSYTFRFIEQSVTTSSSIPIRQVPDANFYLKQHIVHPVLQMWMHSNFDRYDINSTVAKISRIVRNVLWC